MNDTGKAFVPESQDDDDANKEIRQHYIGGAKKVIDTGVTSQRHNRSNNVITKTWPGDDTFSVSWAQSEDVRRYKVLAERIDEDVWATGTAYPIGTILHATTDNDFTFEVTAIAGSGTSDGTTEPTWPTAVGGTVIDNAGANQITWTARSDNASHVKIVEDAVNESSAEAWLITDNNSTSSDVEYQKAFDGVIFNRPEELTKDPSDLSLSRLWFQATADTWAITVEAE